MQVTIDRRFRGPSSSGNGGYTAGRLAQALRSRAAADPGAVTVRLSAPPPLDRPLDVLAGPEAGTVRLVAGGTTIAGAAPASGWVGDPVPFVEPDEAAVTASRYIGPDLHPFPQCFVCGPAREPGDGMRLTPGRVSDGHTACLWRPADLRLQERGRTSRDSATHDAGRPVGEATFEPFVWSALDCPSGWACDIVGRPMVLGTITAEVLRDPGPVATCVVTGRFERADGRRFHTSSALWSVDGELLARAEQIWFQIDAAAFNAILAAR